MSKNVISGVLAACVLSLTSCIYDGLDQVKSEDETMVTFSFNLEKDIATRAISDGAKVTKLIYSIYKIDASGNAELQHIAGSVNGQVIDEQFSPDGSSVLVSLAKGQTYRAVFWAQKGNSTAYDTRDLTDVKVKYDNATNNNETRDAFFVSYEFVAVDGGVYDVVLKRPFAQVNVGITVEDWDNAVASGFVPDESSVVIRNAATSINLLTGAVGEETTDVEVSYLSSRIPNETLYVDTDGDDVLEEYKWLSMSYILVPDRDTNLDPGEMAGAKRTTVSSAEFTFTSKTGDRIVLSEGLDNIPVQRNWRTNILGRVLTGDAQLNITIDPTYINDYVIEYPPYKDVATGVKSDIDENIFYVDSSDGLEWLAGNLSDYEGFEGKTILLMADVDLTDVKTMGDSFAPIGSTGERDSRNRLVCETFKGTFDGNGKTITGLYQSGWDMGYEWGQYGSVGLFSSLENATVKNVVIEGMEAQVEGGDIAFIAGSAEGTCVFENITISNSSIGTYNNGIGSIIGWSGAGDYTFKNITIEEDVVLGGLWGSFDSSVGGVVGQAEPGATYNFEDVTIGCRLDVYNDVTASYQYYLYRMSGMIVGRCEATTTIDGVNYPDLSQYNFTFNNVTVNFGDWMNYHYCYGFNGSRYTRVESGYAYGGLDVTAEGHDETCTDHMLCLPFNALIGGDQYGVHPITEIEGVTVNYPASYSPDSDE